MRALLSTTRLPESLVFLCLDLQFGSLARAWIDWAPACAAPLFAEEWDLPRLLDGWSPNDVGGQELVTLERDGVLAFLHKEALSSRVADGLVWDGLRPALYRGLCSAGVRRAVFRSSQNTSAGDLSLDDFYDVTSRSEEECTARPGRSGDSLCVIDALVALGKLALVYQRKYGIRTHVTCGLCVDRANFDARTGTLHIPVELKPTIADWNLRMDPRLRQTSSRRAWIS